MVKLDAENKEQMVKTVVNRLPKFKEVGNNRVEHVQY